MTALPDFNPDESDRNRACIDLSDDMAAYLDQRFPTRSEVIYAALDDFLSRVHDRDHDLVCADCGALQGSVESYCWQCQHDQFMTNDQYHEAAADGGEEPDHDLTAEELEQIENDPVLTVDDYLEYQESEA